MKKVVFFTVLLVSALSSFCVQYDGGFFAYKKGIKFELTSYSGEGTMLAVTQGEVVSISADGAIVEEKIKEDEQQTSKLTYKVINDGKTTKFNVASSIPRDVLEIFDGKSIKGMDGDLLVIPNELEKGQELESSHGSMTIETNSGEELLIDIIVSQRRVLGKERQVTHAGSFDTYKILQTVDFKTATKSAKIHSMTWFARNIGIVKLEIYDERGKVKDYQLLTSFLD